jgi:cytochrome oxidase Cu insertion factor (SCO1/SenC/PrrC family)
MVPAFVLTERNGRRVTREALQSRVWVTNFFYTRCPDVCPLQSTKIAGLQQDFADHRDVRLVSISIDPEHDTPDVLQDYAQKFGADSDRWLFLTGEKTAIYRLAQNGFHLSVVDPNATPLQSLPTPPHTPSGSRLEPRSSSRQPRSQSMNPLETQWRWVLMPRLAQAHTGAEQPMMRHSSRFVLVDRRARIRGYYHSNDESALQRLRRDVQTLLREPN